MLHRSAVKGSHFWKDSSILQNGANCRILRIIIIIILKHVILEQWRAFTGGNYAVICVRLRREDLEKDIFI